MRALSGHASSSKISAQYGSFGCINSKRDTLLHNIVQRRRPRRSRFDAGGAMGEGKRSRDRSPTSAESNKKEEKARKLSSIAERALASLRSDGSSSGSSSSISGGDNGISDGERDTKEQRERGPLPVLRMATEAIHSVDNEEVVAAEKQAGSPKRQLDTTDNTVEPDLADSGDSPRKAGIQKKRDGQPSPLLMEHSDIIYADDVPEGCADAKSYEMGIELDDTNADPVDGSTGGVVLPHEASSDYNDILSLFTSTPFDDKTMLTLHRLKEGIAQQKHDTLRESLQPLPVIPHKEFIKAMKQKGEILTLRNPANGDTSPTAAAAINDQISAFLAREGQKLLLNSLLQSNDANDSQQESLQCLYPPPPNQNLLAQHPQPSATTNHQQTSVQQQTQSHVTQQPQERNLSQLQSRIPQNNQQPQTSAQQHSVDTRQIQQLQHNMQQYQPPNHGNGMANYPGGIAHQQNQYSQIQNMCGAFNPLQQMNFGYQQNIVNGWQHQWPYAAPQTITNNLAAMSHEYNGLAPAGAAQSFTPNPQFTQPKIVFEAPKVLTASAEISVTDLNREDVAKLPVAFGFALNSSKSQSLAKKAAKKWTKEGMKAAESAKAKPLRRSRVNPSLPPSVPAGPGFPDGWTTRTFQRGGATPGKKAGTYKNLYSPETKQCFRSQKGAKIFIQILAEPEINGDEKLAYQAFISRGHKV